MSKTVKIPDNMKPWRAELNGVKYEYEAGSTQTVPDEVAELIARSEKRDDAPAAKAPWEIEIPEQEAPASELPEVSADDNGDVLTVVEGAWAKAAPTGGNIIISRTGANNALDKTWQEIFDAVNAGKIVGIIIVYSEEEIMMTFVGSLSATGGAYSIQCTGADASFITDSADGYPVME